MTTYTIYIGSTPIACVSGTDAAYDCYDAAKTIAAYSDRTASLVWDETGEEVAFFDPEEVDEPADIDDDCGFDPYEGCYTYDC